jgi:RNA polymerase sigma factor (sigma-70 family)
MDANASDEELMAAYVDGDPRAFELLFARYAARVHAFFARTFRSRAVADDLVQTTFLKIHAARASYERERPVRPWLFGIAARVRIDELRRRYRKSETGDEDLDAMALPAPAGHDAWPEANEAAERVRRAVDALPEGQRVVVLLHRFEGMTFGEIAETLSAAEGAARITEVAVRVRAFRAYDALRKALSDLAEDAIAPAARSAGEHEGGAA